VRLLVKILDRLMPESNVREELETQNIRVQDGRQLHSGRTSLSPCHFQTSPVNRCSSTATWSHKLTIYSVGWENGGSSSTSGRAP